MFSSAVLMLRTGYRIRTHKKPGQLLRLAGWVRTEIADCVTKAERLLAGRFVQLFYVGALNVLWRRHVFDFRLFFAELDKQVFFFVFR